MEFLKDILRPNQESKHTTQLEAKNVYGYALSRYVLTNELKCIDPKS